MHEDVRAEHLAGEHARPGLRDTRCALCNALREVRDALEDSDECGVCGEPGNTTRGPVYVTTRGHMHTRCAQDELRWAAEV